MTIRKARPKQVWKPPPAADHNAMAAAADMYRRGPDRTPERQQPVETDVIMVRNDSGSDKRRGDVLAVTKTKLLSALSREHPWVTADGLDAANRNYILCVLLDPLPDGKIGAAQLSGVSLAYVNVTATWHRRAFPYGASTVQSGLFGPMELLNSPTATGEQLCLVKIGHADNRSVVAMVGLSGISAARRRKRCLTLGSGMVSLYGPTSTVGQHCLLTDASGSPLTVTAYNTKCEGIERNKIVRLEPGDDWLPLALDPSCDESSSSSDSSSSDSSSEPSSSESSSESSRSKSSSRPSSSKSSSRESSSQPSSSQPSSSQPSSSQPSSSQPPSSQPSSSEESSSEPSASDSGPSEGSEPPPSENSGASGSEVSGASEASVQSEASEASEASDESGASGASETSDSEPSSESWSGSAMSGSGSSGGSASSVAVSSGSPPPPFDCEDDPGHCLYYANSSLEWYLFNNGCMAGMFGCGCNYATGGDPTCPPPQFEGDYCLGPCRPAGFW